MDDTLKRWLVFMAVAFLIVQVFGPKLPPVKPGSGQDGQASDSVTTQTLRTVDTETASDYFAPTENTETTIAKPLPVGEDVVVQTETLEVTFTTAGALPTSWKVIDPEFAIIVQEDIDKAIKAKQTDIPKIRDFKAIELIPDYQGLRKETRDYPLMVILKEDSGGRFHKEFNQQVYQTEGPEFDETDGSVIVRFTLNTDDGLRLTKTFRFPQEGYLVDLRIELENPARPGAQKLAFYEPTLPGMGLTWGPGIGDTKAQGWNSRSYMAAVFRKDGIESDRIKKWDKSLMGEVIEETYEEEIDYAFVDSSFYMAAIIPDKQGFADFAGKSPFVRAVVKSQNVPQLKKNRENMTPPINMEIYSGGFLLAPGETRRFDYHLFAGPKKRSLLKAIDKENGTSLHEVMFHSTVALSNTLIRPIAVFMLMLLNYFGAWTGNYGVAIIMVVLVMRLLTQPLTHISMKSMAQVKAEQMRIKPLIDAINEKYKDDPQKKSAETWKTYREHGVNPLGMLKGCIWMFVQMPIFFALYRLLMGAVELRGESFLWIADLTAPDALFTLPFALPFLGNKFNILPILMGVSQIFAQKLQSAEVEDPMQKQMMLMMPVMFIFMLYNFAAGLSLYWFVSNLWQISFQVFVNKRVKEEAEQKAIHAFEERQKLAKERAAQHVTHKGKKGKAAPERKMSFMERLTALAEEKAKEAEEAKKKKGKK